MVPALVLLALAASPHETAGADWRTLGKATHYRYLQVPPGQAQQVDQQDDPQAIDWPAAISFAVCHASLQTDLPRPGQGDWLLVQQVVHPQVVQQVLHPQLAFVQVAHPVQLVQSYVPAQVVQVQKVQQVVQPVIVKQRAARVTVERRGLFGRRTRVTVR